MPLRLLKYGLRRTYPVTGDIPATPLLKPHYDVVIIGGGGHGLACSYYLSRYHGIRNVAVLEKGYLAGGNTARNTTTIRSNYITPQSIAFFKEGVTLYGEMSQELDFNVMFSQRGQLTLAHNEATLRSFHLRAETGMGLTFPAAPDLGLGEGCLVLRAGSPAGHITSYAHSPSLGHPIALAYVHPADSEAGSTVTLRARNGNRVTGTVTAHAFFDPNNSRQER